MFHQISPLSSVEDLPSQAFYYIADHHYNPQQEGIIGYSFFKELMAIGNFVSKAS
jgi:hypothetical protein